jgi:signal transduction histidine kinase
VPTVPATTQGAQEARCLGTPGLIALGTAGVLLSAAVVTITLLGDMPHRGALAQRSGLIVLTPIAVGLYAWRDGTHARFGRLLVLAGFAWFLAGLAGSTDSILYSIGRVAGWPIEAGLLYLMLAFPSGRLTNRTDRLLAAAIAGVVVVLFVPSALFTETYPAPSQFSTCHSTCPANAFMLLGSEPAFMDDVVVPLRETLAAVLLLAVVLRLTSRMGQASRLMRKTLTPVLVVAIIRTLAIAVGFAARRAGASDAVIDVITAIIAFGLPAICLAFVVGLLRWRIYTADCLMRLAHEFREPVDPEQRRQLIAETLGDRSTALAHWRNGSWVGTNGEPTTLPAPGSGRSSTLISDDEGPVAALIHEDALEHQQPFVEAVGTYAFVWDDNYRLAARAESSLRELHESRARILAAADDERRRIERDLHDGGQQRLVALRIRLEMAVELMSESPTRATEILRRLGDDVDAALDELRSLAAGVYPSLLAARGLSAAIRTAALDSTVPTRVRVDGSDRYPPEVETAAYFCCVEALQNVAKHAPRATSVDISLWRNGDLRFEVSDNGPGFDTVNGREGSGLVNMRDRLAAVGGSLALTSALGEGTSVTGTIPVSSTG